MIGQDIGMEVRGRFWSMDWAYCHRFDARKPKPSRAILTAGFSKRYHHWSVMLQVYRPGMALDWHTDGHRLSNKVWSAVLWSPLFGGDLHVKGLCKKWWIFRSFDGGQYEHCVTPCFGYRIVLMIQRGQPLPRVDKPAEQ